MGMTSLCHCPTPRTKALTCSELHGIIALCVPRYTSISPGLGFCVNEVDYKMYMGIYTFAFLPVMLSTLSLKSVKRAQTAYNQNEKPQTVNFLLYNSIRLVKKKKNSVAESASCECVRRCARAYHQ